MADIRKKFMELKVVELRQELEKLGLDKNGVKLMLVDRLVAHYSKQSSTKEEPMTTETTASDSEPASVDNVKVEEVAQSIDEANVIEEKEADFVGGGEEDLSSSHAGEDDTTGTNNEGGNDDVRTAEGNEEEQNEAEVELSTAMVADNAINEVDQQIEECAEGGELNQCQGLEAEAEKDADDNQGTPEIEMEAVTKENDEDNDVDGDALNLSVEENEVLGIEQDDKKSSDEPANQLNAETETVATATTESSTGNKEGGSSNASSATINDGDQENKDAEGNSGETPKSTESERNMLLVTGLSCETSANDLKSFFRKHAKIGRIKIMTNTRIPGSLRFAHVSITSMDELNYLIGKFDGVQLRGKTIGVSKAPEDGSVAMSYAIAVAAAAETVDKKGDSKLNTTENSRQGREDQQDSSDDIQIIQDIPGRPESNEKEHAGDKNESQDKKKQEGKDSQGDKGASRSDSDRSTHKPRREHNFHDRHRGADHPRLVRNFRRDRDPADWRRRGVPRGPMDVTRVHRDRPPIGRGHPHPNAPGTKRRSPHHAPQLTFEQIREIRDEQRRRETERRKREEERERAVETERQKKLEYQNYMEFKQLEREREKLRVERERIEKDKMELIRMERERQKAEREKIEKEREELRRAKYSMEHSHRSAPMKRPYEDEKDKRRDSEDRKKPYSTVSRVKPEGKTEAERTVERERFDRVHSSHTSDTRPRSPPRDSRRESWARDDNRDRLVRSDDRGHRREPEPLKSSLERRGREAPSRPIAGSSEMVSMRYGLESSHSSSRSSSLPKRPTDRYDDIRTSHSTARDGDWTQRSSYVPTGSMSLSSSVSSTRDNWPMAERKIEAWDTSRLPPRTEQWISGANASVGVGGRSSLPLMAPPPPMYSHAAASLALPSSSLGLGSYASSDRYDYKNFQNLRRF